MSATILARVTVGGIDKHGVFLKVDIFGDGVTRRVIDNRWASGGVPFTVTGPSVRRELRVESITKSHVVFTFNGSGAFQRVTRTPGSVVLVYSSDADYDLVAAAEEIAAEAYIAASEVAYARA